ncbi:nucleotidyltransferase family protein [Haladaptatus sp. NG-SE-30]
MTGDNVSDGEGSRSHTFDDERQVIGGVLLAAGKGERFEGGNKLLTPVDDEPLVRHSVQSLMCASLDEICVVVGYDADAVRDSLVDFDVSFRYNAEYAEGQSTSVRDGVAFAQERDWDAIVFALGDMPFVDSETIDALLDAYRSGTGTIVAASYDGKRGNPVLFGDKHFDALATVAGDRGGRRLIVEHEDSVLVETDDAGVTRDIDYVDDLKRFTK